MQTIVLASSSPFRRELLQKLGLDFECLSPDIDESAQDNETPFALVERLARQKAMAVAESYPNAVIIGSDQVAVLGERILGKPHNHNNAVEQLTACSNKQVRFLTGLAVYNSQTETIQSLVEPFDVHFRSLSSSQINSYLYAEQPYNCAGSFKSEGLGISLFSKLSGDDPNSLIGLPLIRLIDLLDNEGISVLSEQGSNIG